MRPILHCCKFRSILLVFGLLLANAIAGWAEPVTVRYKNSVSIAVAGATAAFPLDPLIADSWAQDGTVTITGKSPGTTHIVVATQREAAEAFIASQPHAGWQLIPDSYDDGGFSGGTWSDRHSSAC